MYINLYVHMYMYILIYIHMYIYVTISTLESPCPFDFGIAFQGETISTLESPYEAKPFRLWNRHSRRNRVGFGIAFRGETISILADGYTG